MDQFGDRMVASPRAGAGRGAAGLDTLEPGRRTLALYGCALAACARRERQAASEVMLDLIGSLNFDYGQIAEGFYRLYDYCLGRIRRGEFEAVAAILQELRDTWTAAGAGTVPPSGSDRSRAPRSLRSPAGLRDGLGPT